MHASWHSLDGVPRSDAVSTGMDVTFNASWEKGVELPPFKVDNNSAVEFLRVICRIYVLLQATYSPLRRWGEWRQDGPTYTS
eukprot:783143-Pleurochrysis_carterae.AAC.1